MFKEESLVNSPPKNVSFLLTNSFVFQTFHIENCKILKNLRTGFENLKDQVLEELHGPQNF